MLHFTDMLLQQRSLLQKAEMRVKVPSPPRMCLRHTVVCHTPLQTLQQSINQALEAQRLESEQQLAFTAEFIAPKWPQLRAEITKVSSCQPGPGRACSVFPPITHRCSRGCASLTL